MYIILLAFARSIATSPHALSAMPATSLVSWPLEKAIAPVALERAHFPRAILAPFRFRAPRRRSPTRKYLVQIQVAPPFGANAVGTALPLHGNLLVASTLGRANIFACPAEQSLHACWNGSAVERRTRRPKTQVRFLLPTPLALCSLGHAAFLRAPPDKPHTQ